MDRPGRVRILVAVTVEGPKADDPEASGRLLFALALLAGALLRLVLLGRPDLFGADEGTWAVGARNLVEGDGAQALALSATPLGEPAGTPILFPVVLSVMVRVFGPEEWAIRFPSAVAGLIGAFVLERIIRRGWGQPAGHLAGAFAALLPPLVSASRAATVEPMLAAGGLAGILFGLRAFEEDEPVEAALAGLFFGLGFLAKGYAVGLYLLPLLAALAVRPRLFGLGRTWRSLGLLAAVFVLIGGARLLAVALFRPDLFLFQLATLFGASEAAARVAAAPTAFAADPKSLVSTLFFFLPLAGAGVAVLSRPVGEGEIDSGATGGERRLDHRVLWGVFFVELVVVVAIAGRLRLSSIPVLPAVAALAGLGGAALLRPSDDPARRRRETRSTIIAGLFVLAVAAVLAASPVEPLFGGKERAVNVTAALAAIAGVALAAAILLRGLGARLLGGRLAFVFLTGLLVAGGRRVGAGDHPHAPRAPDRRPRDGGADLAAARVGGAGRGLVPRRRARGAGVPPLPDRRHVGGDGVAGSAPRRGEGREGPGLDLPGERPAGAARAAAGGPRRPGGGAPGRHGPRRRAGRPDDGPPDLRPSLIIPLR